MSERNEQIDCDVLVIGSGAAGLAAAVTAAHHGLRVVVAEKHSHFGGTSAWSGGWLWVPRNPLAVAAGIVEDESGPREYLASEFGAQPNDPRIDAFLHNAPQMVQFFREHTAVDWIDGNRIPDFHHQPGALRGGRSVCAAPFDGRELGAELHRLREPLDLISLWGMGIGSGVDLGHFYAATRKPASALYATRRLLRHFWDRLSVGRGAKLFNGNALVARLLRSALDLNVTLLTGSGAQSLLHENGRVCGAELADGKTVRATRGVVLACGGFPHDKTRIAQLFKHAPTGTEHCSAAPPTNTGDGLTLGEQVGARVSDLPNPGAWAPVSLVPRADGTTGHFPHLIERAKPGIIAVGPDGKRFVNEANSYHDFMRVLFAAYPETTTPHAWLIADSRAQRRYGLGFSRPFPFPLGGLLRNGYLKKGRDLAELARACDLPEAALAETLARFNQHATAGSDPDFARGQSPYNQIQGDAEHAPNPSLGALATAPFYAVKVVPGSLGTFAGLITDAQARVLDAEQKPIDGLFAVGNDMSSVMGGHYPSGGITLGPGMTFGYIAGRTLAGQATDPKTHPTQTKRGENA